MQEINTDKVNCCEECGSEHYCDKSQMAGLCPECSYMLYGYEICTHAVKDGRCIKYYWDGSTSKYITSIKEKQN